MADVLPPPQPGPTTVRAGSSPAIRLVAEQSERQLRRLQSRSQWRTARRRVFKLVSIGFSAFVILSVISMGQQKSAPARVASLPASQPLTPLSTQSMPATSIAGDSPTSTAPAPTAAPDSNQAIYTPDDCDYAVVPYTTTSKLDYTLALGQSRITTYGQNGEQKICYPYGRTQLGVTTIVYPPVTQVRSIGMYIAPVVAPDYSGYTNSDGSYIPSPNTSGDTIGGYTPTYTCNDGTYSYAQHSQGACSDHGGIAD